MNSAMNIEFVYIILLGIGNFMENIKQQNESYVESGGIR